MTKENWVGRLKTWVSVPAAPLTSGWPLANHQGLQASTSEWVTTRDPHRVVLRVNGAHICGSTLKLGIAGHETNICKHLLFTKSSYRCNAHLVDVVLPMFSPLFITKVERMVQCIIIFPPNRFNNC